MDLQRLKHGLKKCDENDEAAITSINCQKSVLSFENNQVSVIQNFQKAFAEIDILTISFYNTVRRQSKQGKPPTVKPILIWQIAHSLSQKVIKKTQAIRRPNVSKLVLSRMHFGLFKFKPDRNRLFFNGSSLWRVFVFLGWDSYWYMFFGALG